MENKIKLFVIKYEKWYYYCDDVEGDLLVSDINDARVFTEKQLKDVFGNDLNEIFNIGDTLFCAEKDNEIELKHNVELVELNKNGK